MAIPETMAAHQNGNNASRNKSQSPVHHDWTDFEMKAVYALICKHVHRHGDSMRFATELNKALNPSGKYHDDIPHEAVASLLQKLYTEHKGSLTFVWRQPAPSVLTRSKARVLARRLPYDGSLAEWEGTDGQGGSKMKMREERMFAARARKVAADELRARNRKMQEEQMFAARTEKMTADQLQMYKQRQQNARQQCFEVPAANTPLPPRPPQQTSNLQFGASNRRPGVRSSSKVSSRTATGASCLTNSLKSPPRARCIHRRLGIQLADTRMVP